MHMRANMLCSLCFGSAISSDCLDVYVCVCVVYIWIGVTSAPHLFQEDRCKTELLQSVRFSEFPSWIQVLDWERNMGSWVGEMTNDIEDIRMKEWEERWIWKWRKALLNGYMFSVMKRAIEPEHSLQSLSSHCNTTSSLASARQRHTLRRYRKKAQLNTEKTSK